MFFTDFCKIIEASKLTHGAHFFSTNKNVWLSTNAIKKAIVYGHNLTPHSYMTCIFGNLRTGSSLGVEERYKADIVNLKIFSGYGVHTDSKYLISFQIERILVVLDAVLFVVLCFATVVLSLE